MTSNRAEEQREVAAARRLLQRAVDAANDGRPLQAIPIFGEIEGRFSTGKSGSVRAVAAEALLNRAAVYEALDRVPEALGDHDAIVRRFGGDDDERVLIHVAWAMNNRGVLLWRRGERRHALEAYRSLVDRFDRSDSPMIQERVVDALDSMMTILSELDHRDEALQVAEEILRRRGLDDSTAPLFRARALMFEGLEFRRRKELERALQAFDQVIALASRRGGDTELDEHAAWAYADKAATLLDTGMYEAAIAAVDTAVERFPGRGEPALRPALAAAIVNKAHALRKLGLPREALAAYRLGLVIDTEPNAEYSQVLRRQAANARVGAGIALEEMGEPLEAERVYRDVVTRYKNDADPGIVECVTVASSRRSSLAECLGREES